MTAQQHKIPRWHLVMLIVVPLLGLALFVVGILGMLAAFVDGWCG